MYHTLFPLNQILLLAGNDVKVFSPLGARPVVCRDGFLKGDLDFILVINKHVHHAQFTIKSRFTVIRKWRHSNISAREALKVIHWGGVWKGDPTSYWFLIISTRLPFTVSDFIKFFRQPGMTALCYLRKNALQLSYMCGFWESDTNFILVFISNHTSIMHRFWYNNVLPAIGNDVIVLSPWGGAAGGVWMRVIQGGQRLYISVYRLSGMTL